LGGGEEAEAPEPDEGEVFESGAEGAAAVEPAHRGSEWGIEEDELVAAQGAAEAGREIDVAMIGRSAKPPQARKVDRRRKSD
jgi:hypothetical protein